MEAHRGEPQKSGWWNCGLPQYSARNRGDRMRFVAPHDSVRAAARVALALAPIGVIGIVVATIVAVPRYQHARTIYAGVSPSAEAVDLAAGVCLVAAGVVISVDRPGGARGLVAMLAGLAWFAPHLVGWEGGPPVLRSVGMVVQPMYLPLVLHLVLEGLGGTRARVAVAAAYIVTATLSLGQALVRDPFLDPYCWNNCRDNVFLLVSAPELSRAVSQALLVAGLTIGAGIALAAAWQLASSTWTGRRAGLPVLFPGMLIGAESVTHALVLVARSLEATADPVFVTLFFARAASAVLLGAGLVWVHLRARRTRATVARLATELGDAPRPGALGQALGRATGDAGLTVVYPIEEGDRYVDASGLPVVLPQPGAGRGVTPIISGEKRVALVLHDDAAVDAAQLRQEIGAAARLAIENERLQAEILARLWDLRASRVRIIESGDAERRRLERNLHDGAQQRLLALTYDLQRALVAAEAGPEPAAAELRGALEDARAAIAELRELAHGIYPAVLTEAGIGAALWTLTDSAPILVEIDETPDERFP
jgi:signal transduction histidine kinase